MLEAEPALTLQGSENSLLPSSMFLLSRNRAKATPREGMDHMPTSTFSCNHRATCLCWRSTSVCGIVRLCSLHVR